MKINNMQTELEVKIDKMLGQIGSAGSANDSVQTLIGLYDLAARIPQNEIQQWLEITDQEERQKFVVDAYMRSGIDRFALASNETRLISDLDPKYCRILLKIIMQEKLPNPEVSEVLLKKLAQNRLGDFSHFSKEMAELSYAIVESIKKPETALCMGMNSIIFALHACKYSKVFCSWPPAGAGRVTVEKLYNIAGNKIKITDEESFSSDYKKAYSCGFLSGAWRFLKFSSNPEDDFLNEFHGVAPEVMGLEAMIRQVDGLVICVVPPSWLFKTTAQDLKFKQYLVQSGLLDSVIQLPSGVLGSTSVPPALLIINTQHKNEGVQFIDASGEEFLKVIGRTERSIQNIEKIVCLYKNKADEAADKEISVYQPNSVVLSNDCNLDVRRYVSTIESQRLEALLLRYDNKAVLGDLAEIVRCHAIKSVEGGEVELKEISPSHINEYSQLVKSKEHKLLKLASGDIARASNQKVMTDDIILTIKGGLGKCALVDPEFENYIANQSFVILRVRSDSPVSNIVLFRYLSSDLGKVLINRWATGSTIKMIKMQDLKNLPVPIPSQKEQAGQVKTHRKIIDLLEKKRAIEDEINIETIGFWE